MKQSDRRADARMHNGVHWPRWSAASAEKKCFRAQPCSRLPSVRCPIHLGGRRTDMRYRSSGGQCSVNIAV